MSRPDDTFDIFVIGGGINGCGIARDAAGRGLSVGLAEMNDLASATSQASTKLFHGGLRYLEYFEFRLVREALKEREVLLRAMPHIAWPLRFVLPTHADMRFEGQTPASRLIGRLLPWLRGRRPAWLIRLGLFLYDHLGGREILPGTGRLDLAKDPSGAALKPCFKTAFEYSDAWVDDARLVLLNARDAARHGAQILTRTKVVQAKRHGALWDITLEQSGLRRTVQARALVNAAGPWVGDVIQNVTGFNRPEGVRLVRGSHLVTTRLFAHDKAYLLQGSDGRVVFAIPYEDDFTLLGTTDQDHADPHQTPVCSPEEEEYLLEFASQFFAKPVTSSDVLHRFSGLRPLYDDGATTASAATRDYVLSLDAAQGAPLLNIFGGKITTYRKLAEAALAKLTPLVGGQAQNWTARAPLPGGNFAVADAPHLPERLLADYPFLTRKWALRLTRSYGLEAWDMLGAARSADDLGKAFGATLTAAELDWAIAHEWVTQADDFLWRRSKLGLRMNTAQVNEVEAYITAQTRLEAAS